MNKEDGSPPEGTSAQSLSIDAQGNLLGVADERWKPRRLPWLMRLVTSVVPVFRRWPTTYRWKAELGLDSPATVTARWTRTGAERGDSYRRATSS